MESNHTGQSRLLDDVVESGSDAEQPVFSSRYYTLPYLRFINVVRVILFVDVISSLVLWLLGVNADEHFIENIVHFHIKSSTFDLAMLATIKTVLLIILYSKLEDTELSQIEEPFHAPHTSKKKILYIFLIIITLISGFYPIAKGSFILYFYLTDDSYQIMCLTYNVLTISAVTFGLIEMALLPYCPRAMRKVKVIRILHRLNDSGQEVDDNGEVIKRKANLGRVIRLAKPETNLILIAMLSLFVSCAAQTAAPYFFGAVIDAAQKSMADLNRTVVILLIVYAIGSVAAMLRAWLFTLAGQRLVARLRKQLFSSIIKQEVAFFDTNRTGELTNRLSSDTQVVQNAITVNLSMLARYLLQIVGSLIFMFILNAALTGVLLAVVPIISLGAVRYGYYVKDLRQMFQDRLADASTQAEESISSIRTVRSFVGESKSDKDYGFDIDRSYQVGKKLALVQGIFGGVIGMFAYGGITLVLWYGGKLVFDGVVSAGTLTSFLLYTLQVALAFGLISAVYGEFMQAVGASIRIFDLMDRTPKVPLEGGEVFPDIQGSIEFKNVKFTYPSRPDTEVLKGVNFKVSPGEMVALVGPSGGGKSTIVSLIERFYDPDSGSILLGGHDLKSLDPQWYRTKLAMVSQEPTLFACSIKDNIGYGLVATEEQVVEMAKKANAHDFIMDFEQQYDTTVGERGVRLSGGQKQRVAIARALIVNPRILLLDEATSALDAESEHLVQEAVDRAMINRTVVVVAHRLSTVRNASKVIVIDKGEIAESGTHEELLALDGVYKRLVLRQLMAGNTSSDILSSQQRQEQTEDSNKTLPLIGL